ncbi:MAG TPA: hypothetical protein VNA19_14150 [Pyrinomonadaceae bacterium]|nr:hypothetical protein [Pyrinomonadaceae bacterium]
MNLVAPHRFDEPIVQKPGNGQLLNAYFESDSETALSTMPSRVSETIEAPAARASPWPAMIARSILNFDIEGKLTINEPFQKNWNPLE